MGFGILFALGFKLLVHYKNSHHYIKKFFASTNPKGD